MSKRYFSTDAVSNSAMKQILISPAHYRAWDRANKAELPSDALRFGTAFHTMVLEPTKISSIEIWTQTKTLASKAADQERRLCPDKTFVTLEEWQTLKEMQKAVLFNPMIEKLLGPCEMEREIYGEEKTQHGVVKSKAMVDAICDRYILDLKSTRDLATDFPYAARKFRYRMQAAWYRHMAFTHVSEKQRDFYFIVVEKNPPYGILVYQVTPESFEEGERDYGIALDRYAACRKNSVWGNYDINVLQLL